LNLNVINAINVAAAAMLSLTALLALKQSEMQAIDNKAIGKTDQLIQNLAQANLDKLCVFTCWPVLEPLIR
jgi:hypothetical protein